MRSVFVLRVWNKGPEQPLFVEVSQAELDPRGSGVRQCTWQTLLRLSIYVQCGQLPGGCWGHRMDLGLEGGGQLLVWASFSLLADKNLGL